MSEKLEFDLSVKNNQLEKALDSGNKKAINLEGTLSTALGVFSGNIITKGFDLFVDGISSAIDFTKQAIEASAAQEVAINNLNNSLARAGNFTREASNEIQAFASNLQALSTFEDDAAIASAALLQSLTKLSADGLAPGVQAAADFATVLGIDLETATRLVAKAANGNVEAFKRYGVEIQKGKSDAETFANTLESLNKQFGGAASSQLNTYAGATKSLSNAFGELQEPIGDIIVKNPILVASVNAIKDIVNSLTAEIEANKAGYIELVQDGILFAISSAQVLFDALDGITVVSKALFNILVTGSNAITLGLVEPFRLAYDAALLLLQNLPLIGQAFEGLKNPLDGLADSLRENVIAGFEDIANSADGNIFRDLSDGAAGFADKVIDGAEKIKLANAEIKNSNRSVASEQDVLNDEQLAKIAEFNSQKLSLQAQFDSEKRTLQDELNELELGNEISRNEAAIQRIFDQKLRENDIALQAEIDKNKGINDERVRAAADEKAYAQKKLADLKVENQKIIALEKLTGDARIAAQRDVFGQIAILSSSSNKELAAIGKAAGITQIAIDTPVAVSKALAAFPPPFNFAAAALVGTAMAAQAARIAGVQFENGGVVGGASVGPDNRVAAIRDGEMVLNAQQQKNLMDMLNNGGSGGDIVIQINEREIARAVRNQRQLGFAI